MAKKNNNVKAFKQWIDAINNSIAEEVKDIVEEYTEAICDETKKRAPVNKGILKDSIDTTFSFTSNDGLTGYIYTPMDYAKYTEFGTVHIERREYFLRSYEEYYQEFIDALKNMNVEGSGTKPTTK